MPKDPVAPGPLLASLVGVGVAATGLGLALDADAFIINFLTEVAGTSAALLLTLVCLTGSYSDVKWRMMICWRRT